jgi:hypothetical protein
MSARPNRAVATLVSMEGRAIAQIALCMEVAGGSARMVIKVD